MPRLQFCFYGFNSANDELIFLAADHGQHTYDSEMKKSAPSKFGRFLYGKKFLCFQIYGKGKKAICQLWNQPDIVIYNF